MYKDCTIKVVRKETNLGNGSERIVTTFHNVDPSTVADWQYSVGKTSDFFEGYASEFLSVDVARDALANAALVSIALFTVRNVYGIPFASLELHSLQNHQDGTVTAHVRSIANGDFMWAITLTDLGAVVKTSEVIL